MHPLRQQLTRNGKTKTGKQKFRCHTCGCYGTLNPDYGYSEERKAEILRAYHERFSLRGLERTFGVARQDRSGQVKKARNLPPLETTLAPAQRGDVLELDELWLAIYSMQGQHLLAMDRTLPPHPASRVLVRRRPERG